MKISINGPLWDFDESVFARENVGQTYIVPDLRGKNEFNNASIVHITLWSTIAMERDLPTITSCVTLEPGDVISLSLLGFDKKVAFKRRLRTVDSNKYSFLPMNVPELIDGQALFLLVAKVNEINEDALSEISNKVINSIRVAHGAMFAERLLLNSFLNIKENTTLTWTDPCSIGIRKAFFDENESDRNLIRSAKMRNHNNEAQILISSYFEEAEEWKKFLYGWMALEAIIGGGGEREKFCKTELGSERINLELYRLFLIRSKLSHEGSYSVKDEDELSLWCFIKIAMMQKGLARARLVKLFHEYLAHKKL